MELINFEEFKDKAQLSKFGSEVLAKFLVQFLQYKKVNKLYEEHFQKSGIEFIDAILDVLGISYEISPDELKRIPASGSFITISNHPYGGLDALILVKLFSEINSDYKILVNKLLHSIEPLNEVILPADSFDEGKTLEHNSQLILEHLATGAPLGIFPAGEVSSYQIGMQNITDREWLTSAIKFIEKAQVPVVPIYFQGTNSRLFQLLGKIHPLLRSAKLPAELFNKKNKTVIIKIGHPISIKEQNTFTDTAQFGRFLRAKTYALGSTIKPQNFFFPLKTKQPALAEELVEAISVDIIASEIDKAKEEYLLFDSKEFSVLCAPTDAFPNVLHEIGRLRERTFREIGEGTNLKIDLDEYDLYYMQLVIWDNTAKSIVGAYRVGKGKDILAQYGKQGFYLQSLFRMKKEFVPILNESLELGRSFICKEYQRKPMSLFLLWKGIIYFLLKNPEYRYLIGPVSISNSFSKFSKDLIVSFVRSNYFNHEMAQHVSPRKRYKIDKTYFDEKRMFVQSSDKDFKKLDKFIRDIEPELVTPVLLKKYISLNAKIIGFNTDPKFNNCLDGLLVLDVFDVPMDTLLNLSKEINDESILERFNQDMGMEFGK